MSAGLEARAEIIKLARLLRKEPSELAYLAKAPPESLRRLRLAATDLLFDGDRAMMTRLAAGAKLLPTSPLATIAERVFGPLLSARVTGYIDPDKAVDVAAKLKPAFLADVAVEIDPRKASTVIGRIPAQQAAAVAEILTARDEVVTMGRFVGHLEDDAIEACLGVIPDEKLLPIAFVMEGKERFDHIMRLLPGERVRRVAADAAASGYWDEALDLAEHLSPEQAARLAGIRVDRVLLSVYLVAGAIYGLTAWILIGRAGAASPNAITDANLESITAVVIGGTSLFGGRGALLGTLLGALIVGFFRSGLSLAGVDDQYRVLAVGLLVILAVAVDQWIRKVRA